MLLLIHNKIDFGVLLVDKENQSFISEGTLYPRDSIVVQNNQKVIFCLTQLSRLTNDTKSSISLTDCNSISFFRRNSLYSQAKNEVQIIKLHRSSNSVKL